MWIRLESVAALSFLTSWVKRWIKRWAQIKRRFAGACGLCTCGRCGGTFRIASIEYAVSLQSALSVRVIGIILRNGIDNLLIEPPSRRQITVTFGNHGLRVRSLGDFVKPSTDSTHTCWTCRMRGIQPRDSLEEF